MNKYVIRFISFIILFSISFSTFVYAAGVGDYNQITIGGLGPYHTAAVMVKADFYKPSDYGIDKSNYSNDTTATGVTFTSVANRVIFEKATKEPALPLLQVTQGGIDSAAWGSLYTVYSPVVTNQKVTYNRANILAEKGGLYAPYGSHGHEVLNPNKVKSQTSGAQFVSWGLYSLDNDFINPLIEATNFGREWNGEAIAKAIEEVWSKYIDPNSASNIGYGSNAYRLRAEFASMFSYDNVCIEISDKFKDYLNNYIAVGKSLPNGVPIQTEAQATRLRDLMVCEFALVLANPYASLQLSDGTVISNSDSYKGDAYKNKLLEWARSGGNSDASDNQLAIKYETYALKIPSVGGEAYLDRWDLAFYSATSNTNKAYFGVMLNTAPIQEGNSGEQYLFSGDYSTDGGSGNANTITRESAEAMLYRHKASNLSPTGNTSMGDPWSPWTIFQAWGLQSGEVSQKSSSGDSYNYRGVCEFNHPDFVKVFGNRTFNIGFNWLWNETLNEGSATGSSGLPNFKMDDELSAPNGVEVERGAMASTRNFFSMMAAPQNMEVIDNDSMFDIDADTDWRPTNTEAATLIGIIHRIEYDNGSQVINGSQEVPGLSGYTYDKLPCVITIKRTFENGSNSDGKILDDIYENATTIQKCGKHNFQVISDDGGTAKVAFNIIPDGECGNQFIHEFTSPILQYVNSGNKEADNSSSICNCFISHLYADNASRIKFNDENIAISEEPGGSTTVNYDFSYTVYKPEFVENEPVYGDEQTDEQRPLSEYNAMGYSLVPDSYGLSYPSSDYKASGSRYIFSDVIRRSITFYRAPEAPTYTNMGYEEVQPYSAEIKTNKPGSETFEAMAGTPTTRDLFTSVGATEFRVDFTANGEEVTDTGKYREYIYTVTANGCWSGHCSHCSPGHEGCEGGCSHKSHTEEHPSTCTFTYTVQIPIGDYTYFDMLDSEVWRLTDWGINGGETFLTNPNPTKTMNTKVWHLNTKDYSSMSGRIVFSSVANDNEEGDLAYYGDNNVDLGSISEGRHSDNQTKAASMANDAKNSEEAISGMVVSDYVVLETSEGFQAPYFYYQEFSNSLSPADAPDFTPADEQTVAIPGSLTVPKQLTINDFWWDNSDHLTCASEANHWDNTSIVFSGYNGKYSDLSNKYKNNLHKQFLSNTNPLEEALSKYDIDVYSDYAGADIDGKGNLTFSKDEGNTEHILKDLDVIDTTPNGEYDTGDAWLRYKRISLYDRNDKLDASSNLKVKFDINGSGTYYVDSVPYFAGAKQINDIVIHDPVSAEYSMVISNDDIYDDRTFEPLEEGGDPPGMSGGVCPDTGCQFSTLSCTTPLTTHTDECYDIIGDVGYHTGNNVHVHNAGCYHKHNERCFSSNVWIHEDDTIHATYSFIRCTTCNNTDGKVCSVLPSTLGVFERRPFCSCGNCGSTYCGYTDGEDTTIYCDENCYCLAYIDCGLEEGSCDGTTLNAHVCTDQCVPADEKILTCSNPHHYEPGEYVNINDPRFHYPLGDSRCWQRCGVDSNHGSKGEIVLPDGTTSKPADVFINLDREFKIYYPFKGDFAQNPSLQGIAETTDIRGHGYENDMNTKEWTDHRWVRFPVNVIDPKGNMRVAWEQIDLNEFSEDDEVFEFYAVLANSEYSLAETKFTTTAINLPVDNRDEYYDESDGETNKNRTDWKYAAKHTAHKFHYIDVVGYIGALTINDTGDFRFSNLFKMPNMSKEFLIPNLVPDVDLDKPNFVVSDNETVRQDSYSKETAWLDTYGTLFSETGGKSGGTDNEKQPLLLPLVPRYNNIESLRNQPMRPGYQLYMDIETVGNYYGESYDADGNLLDTEMFQKLQVRPYYYSLDLDTGEYTPVDAYYMVNNEYMLVNDYDYLETGGGDVGVKDFYLYLDWLNESDRRNFTDLESLVTTVGKSFKEQYFNGGNKLRIPTINKDVIGSSNIIFTNDLDETFIGSSLTYGEDKNPGDVLNEGYYNMQAQRHHFTVSLPSSVVFVKSGVECTESNIEELQTSNRVIIGTLDIKCQGEVWTLQYDGTKVNNNGFKVFEDGDTYDPPDFPGTEDDVIIIIYPPDKTSSDDIVSSGTH